MPADYSKKYHKTPRRYKRIIMRDTGRNGNLYNFNGWSRVAPEYISDSLIAAWDAGKSQFISKIIQEKFVLVYVNALPTLIKNKHIQLLATLNVAKRNNQHWWVDYIVLGNAVSFRSLRTIIYIKNEIMSYIGRPFPYLYQYIQQFCILADKLGYFEIREYLSDFLDEIDSN